VKIADGDNKWQQRGIASTVKFTDGDNQWQPHEIAPTVKIADGVAGLPLQ
jgi:hypothetical protein